MRAGRPVRASSRSSYLTIIASHENRDALVLRTRLGELLDAASAGERILIERDHRPMAVLVSVEDADRLEDGAETREERMKRVNNALERLTALAKEMAPLRPPGAPDAVESIRLDREERREQVLRAARGGRDEE